MKHESRLGSSCIVRNELEALESRHYDIADIADCFSSADLRLMDALARSGDYAEIGRLWSAITDDYRRERLENAIYFLNEERQ